MRFRYLNGNQSVGQDDLLVLVYRGARYQGGLEVNQGRRAGHIPRVATITQSMSRPYVIASSTSPLAFSQIRPDSGTGRNGATRAAFLRGGAGLLCRFVAPEEDEALTSCPPVRFAQVFLSGAFRVSWPDDQRWRESRSDGSGDRCNR